MIIMFKSDLANLISKLVFYFIIHMIVLVNGFFNDRLHLIFLSLFILWVAIDDIKKYKQRKTKES